MNCIKCGREIPEGELFCEQCSQAPVLREPVRKNSSPSRTHKPSKAADSKPSAKNDARTSVRSHGGARLEPAAKKAASDGAKPSRKPLVALIIVSLLLVASLAYITVNFGGLAKDRRRLQAKEADLSLRETEMTEVIKERDNLTAQLSEATISIETLEEQIDQLERDLNASQSSVSQSQYDITSQQQEMELLTAERDELKNAVTNLEGEISQLNTQISQLQASNATYSAKASFMDSYVVFVNNDGSNLYHKYDCSEFTRQNFWAYSRKLAESNGYDPCPKCCK